MRKIKPVLVGDHANSGDKHDLLQMNTKENKIMTESRCATCRIKSQSILRNCSAALLEEISAEKTSQLVRRGQPLLTEGEEAKDIFCIRSGVAKVELHSKEGRALMLRLEGGGNIVGLRTAEKKDRQPLTITAVENMQVCRLSPDQIFAASAESKALQEDITKSILIEIKSVEARALSLAFQAVKERVAWSLLHIAEVYGYRQGGCSIHVHLCRQDIADLAGTTKEQVSAMLAEFRKAKLVNFKAKHFKYFDLAGLRKLLENS